MLKEKVALLIEAYQKQDDKMFMDLIKDLSDTVTDNYHSSNYESCDSILKKLEQSFNWFQLIQPQDFFWTEAYKSSIEHEYNRLIDFIKYEENQTVLTVYTNHDYDYWLLSQLATETKSSIFYKNIDSNFINYFVKNHISSRNYIQEIISSFKKDRDRSAITFVLEKDNKLTSQEEKIFDHILDLISVYNSPNNQKIKKLVWCPETEVLQLNSNDHSNYLILKSIPKQKNQAIVYLIWEKYFKNSNDSSIKNSYYQRIFKKIIEQSDKVNNPYKFDMIAKTIFEDYSNKQDATNLKYLYKYLINSTITLHDLKEHGFSLQEMSYLTGIPKPTIARKLNYQIK